jgi:hypothetical protein
MFGHPFGDTDLALDHAALKRDLALTAVGTDLFNATSGAARHHMTENGYERNEHQISPVSSGLQPVISIVQDACRFGATASDPESILRAQIPVPSTVK